MFQNSFIVKLKKILLINWQEVKYSKNFTKISFCFKDQSFWMKNQLLKIMTFKTHLMFNTFFQITQNKCLMLRSHCKIKASLKHITIATEVINNFSNVTTQNLIYFPYSNFYSISEEIPEYIFHTLISIRFLRKPLN